MRRLWLLLLLCWVGSASAQTNFASGITTGASPPTMAAGTGAFWAGTEGTAPGTPAGTCTAGTDSIWADSIAHTFKMCVNGSTATPIDTTWNVGWFTGSSPAAQMVACLANLPAAGGTCDGQALDSSASRTIDQEVLIGSRQVLLLDASATYRCTVNNAVKDCFHIIGGALVGQGIVGQGNGIGVTIANGASVRAMIEVENATGAQGGDVENIGITGNGSATVAQALLLVYKAINIVNISGVQTTGGGSPVIFKIADSVGPSQFINDYPDCGHPAGACTTMVFISETGGPADDNILIKGGVYAHPGATGGKAFDLQDGGLNTTGVTWEGITAEAYNATDVMWDLNRCTGCKIIGSIVSTGNAPPATGVFIHGLSNNISIDNFTMQATGGSTNTLIDTAQGANFTLTSNANSYINHYGRAGFINNGTWCETMSNGITMCLDNRGVWANNAAGISGGAALSVGSNEFYGRVTGSKATGNIITPGMTCPNAVECALQDNTTSGGAKGTAQSATTYTFSATLNDVVGYHCGCR